MEVNLTDRMITLDENSLVHVQAIWRGAVVRKKMAAIRDAYKGVVMETEEIQTTGYRWRGPSVYLPFQMKLPLNECVTQEEGSHDEQKTPAKSVRIQSDSINSSDADDGEKGGKSQTRLPSSDRTATPDNKKSDPPHPTSTPKNKSSSPSSDLQSDSTPTQSSKVASGSLSSIQQSESEPSGQEYQIHRRHISVSDSTDARDNTSIWDTLDASHITRQSSQTPLPDYSGLNKEELENQRGQIAMELLWIQQAIQSRKEYLRLKQQMVG